MPRTKKAQSVVARLLSASFEYSEALEAALGAARSGSLSAAEKRQLELLRPLLANTNEQPKRAPRQDAERASGEAVQ